MAKFAMAFHCYQPVFNLGWEIEKAYDNAYLPLLKMIEAHPGIKVSFHSSGNMFEWFEDRCPEYIEGLRRLMERKQVEFIGGGCFEPVMAIIPERDRLEQLRMNDQILSRIFGIKPRGIWIAEKVWEPSLADTLASSGVEYTIVDDYHLLQAGVEQEKIFRPCRTRGSKTDFVLFPSLTRLRYYMPFHQPKMTLDHLRYLSAEYGRDDACFFFADDGEKFGAWPFTNWWVYKKRWLEKFFTMLEENSGWLQTATYSEILDTVEPETVDVIPESSYAEMMEWSGGNFKNFFKKYPEADRMRKRMLSVSKMVEDLDGSAEGADGLVKLGEARKELFKAQSNCAYWHGVFGGLYQPHLRSGVYSHLIKAGNILGSFDEKKNMSVRAVEKNYGDGEKETVIENRLIDVFIRPSDGGTVCELDYKPLNMNLVDTMSRVRERYHAKLTKEHSGKVKQARSAFARGDFADVHDALGVRDQGLNKILFYDDYRRRCFLSHIFTDNRPFRDCRKFRSSHDGFLKGKYSTEEITNEKGRLINTLRRRDKVFADNGRPFDLEVVKKTAVGSGASVVFGHKVIKRSGGPVSLRYAVEFNFSVCDKTVFSRPREVKTDHFYLKDKYSGVVLDFSMDKKYDIFMYPVFTVNETEQGLAKTFQGVSALMGGEADLEEESSAGEMEITVTIGK
ncbi:MAG: alpha-amylase/4-alpha-glucanotransferase domain-containing protein [Candidatus Omnitrophota bacterium]